VIFSRCELLSNFCAEIFLADSLTFTNFMKLMSNYVNFLQSMFLAFDIGNNTCIVIDINTTFDALIATVHITKLHFII